jgi:hypothetical protein
LNLHLEIIDGNEIHALSLCAEDRKEVNFAFVTPASGLWVSMMPITATGGEKDSAMPKSARLALHSSQSGTVVDHEVVARVLAERNE